MSALPRRGDPLRALARPGGLAALAVTAIAALLSVQAADGPWLAELGRAIARPRRHPVRRSVRIGAEHGLAQRAGAGRADLRAARRRWGAAACRSPRWRRWPATLALLARDARRAGAQERALAIALLLLLPACFGPIVAIRAELFSLPLFAACVAAPAVGVARAVESHLAARPAARAVGEPARGRAHGRCGGGRLSDLRARHAGARARASR